MKNAGDALFRTSSLVNLCVALIGDAVHFASAVIVGEQGSQAVRFACFDDKLSRAARRQGLAVLS